MNPPLRSIGLLLAVGSAIATTLTARPARAQVTSAPDGTGTTVTVNGSEFRISGGQQAGANLFHSFQQFGLNSEQIATFLAQPQLANILARVTGGDPSAIDGLLQVTGGSPNLYLMNPAGIVFGANARLNVPGDFFATTANAIGFDSGGWFETAGALDDLALLAGTPNQFAFDLTAPAPLINAGALAVPAGQNLTLLGGQVFNTGALQAPGGSITASAVPGSSRVQLSQSGHLLSLTIEPPRDWQGELLPVAPIDLPALLTGSGVDTRLTATGTTIHFTASGQSVTPATGLTALGGSLDAGYSQGTGGAIAVLGDRVALFDADLDASGRTGGGQVLIGGDYQGKGLVPNARRTVVDASSRIRADALDSGAGGRVILWADEATGFWGEIAARGGPHGGDGGFVEVSGKQQLVFEGEVDVAAAAGQHGTLLLDPFNIFIIDAFSAADDFEVSIDGEILLNDAPGQSLVISVDALESQIGTIELQAANDIIVEPGLSLFFDELFDNIIFIADADGEGRGRFVMDGDIDTLGANVYISAAEISVGAIDTLSFTGDSGSVVLIADSRATDSNITFDYIDTSNISGFAGGDVAIVANGTIRGLGTNFAGYTIDTRGGSGGGSVYIEHNGGLDGLPFVVGNASFNGTAGGIATNQTTINSDTFSESIAEIGDVTIVFNGNTEFADEFEFEFDSELFEEDFDDWDELDEFEDFQVVDDIAEFDADYEDFEQDFSEEFAGYFEDVSTPTPVSLAASQQILSEISSQTGQVPSLFYIRYVPAIAQNPHHRPPQPTAANAGDLVANAPRELWRFSGDAAWNVAAPGAATTAQTPAPNPDDLLEIAVIFASGRPVRRVVPGVTRADVERVAGEFRRALTNSRRPQGFRAPAEQLYQWTIAPVEAELQARGVTNLAFVLASGLRSLPMAALHNGEQFLIERYSLGLMPSLSLTDTSYRPVQDLTVLAMGASEFAEQAPLPAVPFELALVSNNLWSGDMLLNQDFTPTNLTARRSQQAHGIVHLGTHGEFQPGRASDSHIWFGNGKLPLARLRELSLNQPPTELLVLSACRTALGDREAELGFAGLAVQAGVKSALGSLWYVSDSGTLAFMTSFYDQLQDAPIKAEALRQAQLSLLRGEVEFRAGALVSPAGSFPLPPELQDIQDLDATALSHPYYWSAFTLIGSPW